MTTPSVTIRRATPADTADVDAQRFCCRLGATLRPKILAAWAPSAYAELAGPLP